MSVDKPNPAPKEKSAGSDRHESTSTTQWDTEDVGLFPTSILSAPLSASALRLWLALAVHANKQGQCWPSRGRILEFFPSSTAPTTIRRARAELEKADLLRVSRQQYISGKRLALTDHPMGRETSSLYTLRMPSRECDPVPPGGRPSALPGESGSTPPGTEKKNNPQEVDAPDPATLVFDTWIEATGRSGRTQLDKKRLNQIKVALEAYPLDDVLDAVVGWRNDPFYCGHNDRGKTYNDLGLLLRDAEHIERFRDLARTGPTQAPSTTPKSWDALRRISEEA